MMLLPALSFVQKHDDGSGICLRCSCTPLKAKLMAFIKDSLHTVVHVSHAGETHVCTACDGDK